MLSFVNHEQNLSLVNFTNSYMLQSYEAYQSSCAAHWFVLYIFSFKSERHSIFRQVFLGFQLPLDLLAMKLIKCYAAISYVFISFAMEVIH